MLDDTTQQLQSCESLCYPQISMRQVMIYSLYQLCYIRVYCNFYYQMEHRFMTELSHQDNKYPFSKYMNNHEATTQLPLSITKRSTNQQQLQFKCINFSQSKYTSNVHVEQISLKDSKWIILNESINKNRQMSLETSRYKLINYKIDSNKIRNTVKNYQLNKKNKNQQSDIKLMKKSKFKQQSKNNTLIKNISQLKTKNQNNQQQGCHDNQNQHQNLPQINIHLVQNKSIINKTQIVEKSRQRQENISAQNKYIKSFKHSKSVKSVKSLKKQIDKKSSTLIDKNFNKLIDKSVQKKIDNQQVKKASDCCQLEHYINFTKCYDDVQLLNIHAYNKFMIRSKKKMTGQNTIQISKQQSSFTIQKQNNRKSLVQNDTNHIIAQKMKKDAQIQKQIRSKMMTEAKNESNSQNIARYSQDLTFNIKQETKNTNPTNNSTQKLSIPQNQNTKINKFIKGYDSLNLNIGQVDEQFLLEVEFKQKQGIRLVKINPNNQTAIFPPKFIKNRHIIHPTINNLPYKNQQIISYLNFLLFINPSIIWSTFVQCNNPYRYCCKLFNSQQAQWIEVDGVFPFDNNYFPLYGYVDQYIWFSVLLKAIAKMKGSYQCLNQITFQELHYLLTGVILQQASKQMLLQQKLKLLSKKNYEEKLIIVQNEGKFYKLEHIKRKIRSIREGFSQQSSKLGTEDKKYDSLAHFLNIQKQKIKKDLILSNINLVLKGDQQNKKIITFQEILKPNYCLFVGLSQLFSDQKPIISKFKC